MNSSSFLDVMRACPRSWGDVALHCYRGIEQLESTEEVFLATCCSDAPGHVQDARLKNPNLGKLEDLRIAVFDIVSQDLANPEESDRARAIKSVCDRALAVDLDEYEHADRASNEATVLWEVIVGIDLAYASCFLHVEETCRGPISRLSEGGGLGVYLKPFDSPVYQAYRASTLCRIPEFSANSLLRALVFYRPRKGCAFPQIRHFAASQGDAGKAVGNGKGAGNGRGACETRPDEAREAGEVDPSDGGFDLDYDVEAELPLSVSPVRVGLCLFTGASLFDFTRDDLPLRPAFRGGKSYAVRYADDYDGLYDRLVAPALERAIAAGCQIVVFPEYVMKPSFQEKLRAQLGKTADRGLKQGSDRGA